MPVAVAQDPNTGAVLDPRLARYPGDEPLAKPVVYYNPTAPNLRFKVYDDPEGKVRFRPEQFHKGRYVAYTRIQQEAVRRVLGRNADRWQGDDARRDLTCDNPSCSFRTRNSDASEDHKAVERLRRDIRPDIPGMR